MWPRISLWLCKRWAAENGYRFVRMESYGDEREPDIFIVEDERGLWRVRVGRGAYGSWADEGEPVESADVITLGVSLQTEDFVESNEDDGWSEPW